MPLIGTVRMLAGPAPDTMLALVALSLRNRGLTFRREGDAFLGEYRVEIILRQGGTIATQVSRDEEVRVATFRETQRVDESIIFQQFLPLAPGAYTLALTVRDRNGPNVVRVEAPVSATSFGAGAVAVALPVAIYSGRSRGTLTEVPPIIANPRGAAEYGGDSLRFYVETYALAPGRLLLATATDHAGRVAWTDTLRVDSAGPVRGLVATIPPQALSIGRYDLQIRLGEALAASVPFLVTFSDQYAVTNLEEIVSLLRYFPDADSLRTILNASEEERAAAWLRFWRRTDPNPATPENEAFDAYLQRVQGANQRFREEGVAGWLTERGMVYISLGEPDEFFDNNRGEVGRGRYIVWNYYEYRLTLRFVDDNGFGRFRLDPRSTSEYTRVLNRIRRL